MKFYFEIDADTEEKQDAVLHMVLAFQALGAKVGKASWLEDENGHGI